MATRTIIFFLVLGLIVVDAQRDSRRRTGRRKPTTESPPLPPEVDEEEQPDPKPKSEAEVEVPATVKPSESENSDTPTESKDSQNNAGPNFLAPRGTRKPRPIRGGGENRPRPTLPNFIRSGASGRTLKSPADFQKTGSKSEDTPTSSTSTTARPARGSSSRRRTNSAATTSAPSPSAQPDENNDSADSPKKRRFGGGSTRRPSRGSRRNTTPSDS